MNHWISSSSSSSIFTEWHFLCWRCGRWAWARLAEVTGETCWDKHPVESDLCAGEEPQWLVLLSGLGHGRRENLWNSLPLALPAGSRSRRQGGASWPMENYFQAEAFNLDKVLDEFEQNEGEELTRTRRPPVCPESRTLNWVGVHGGQFRVTVCDPQTSSRNWTTGRIVSERGFSVKPDTCEDYSPWRFLNWRSRKLEKKKKIKPNPEKSFSSFLLECLSVWLFQQIQIQ